MIPNFSYYKDCDSLETLSVTTGHRFHLGKYYIWRLFRGLFNLDSFGTRMFFFAHHTAVQIIWTVNSVLLAKNL